MDALEKMCSSKYQFDEWQAAALERQRKRQEEGRAWRERGEQSAQAVEDARAALAREQARGEW